MLDRNALFVENLNWSAMIAKKVHRTLPPSFDLCDLKQEAAIELSKRCELYDPAENDSFKGYAYLWVLNAVRMKTRRRAFVEATHLSLETGDGMRDRGYVQARVEMAVDFRMNPEQAFHQREAGDFQRRRQMTALVRLIKTLPVEQMYIVRRVYLNEVDPAAVAQCWGVTQTQVVQQLRSAVRALKAAAKNSAPVKTTCRCGWLFLGSGKMGAV
jgi:RNA polymerase sigma factor (sigma-70 family)